MQDIARWRPLTLWVEFSLLFVVFPISGAVVLPATALFPSLFAFTLVGAVLLNRTPNFKWRSLRQSPPIEWRVVLAVAGVTLVASILVMLLTRPDALFMILRRSPQTWLLIMILYPLISALPQEIVFRPLFFERYAEILPRPSTAIVLNAALFSLAHLLYWSWVVALFTFAGGLVFSWAYRVKKSFPLAVLCHGVAGNILFTVGMGVYFYSGAVERPF